MTGLHIPARGGASAPADSASPPRIAAEAQWRVAVLLSTAGGFLDAFTWVGHGGVFANAQTGNVVLLGVFAASGQWHRESHHIPPVVAFFLGVFVADRLRRRGERPGLLRAAPLSLGCEIVLLMAVACLPRGFPDLPIVLGVAFVAALQSSSFAKVEQWSYSSVMTTGNLRRSAEALFAALTPPRDPVVMREARLFAAVCTTFALGACAGGICTARAGNLAVIAPVVLLLVALGLCMARPRARPASP